MILRRALALAVAASAFTFRPAAVRRAPVVRGRWPWSPKASGDEAGDDITNSPVFLEKKETVLQKELEQLDKDIAAAEAAKAEAWEEWGPQIEKMKAEFEAVKKRTADARAMALTVERADVLDKILGATDNFDRAVMASKAQASASEGAAAVAARYTGEVADAFAEAFKSLNAEKIDEVGVPFDPMVHEAAMTAPDDEIPADHVQKVFQYGLKVGERLVRPATVVVSEGPM